MLQTNNKIYGTTALALMTIVAGISILFFKRQADPFHFDRLLSMIGEDKEAVLKQLKMERAPKMEQGTSEYYWIEQSTGTVFVGFYDGAVLGEYGKAFQDPEQAFREASAIMQKWNQTYEYVELLAAEPSNITANIKSAKDLASKETLGYIEQWHLPRDAAREDAILGERAGEYQGLHAELRLDKYEHSYIVRIRVVANPKAPFQKGAS